MAKDTASSETKTRSTRFSLAAGGEKVLTAAQWETFFKKNPDISCEQVQEAMEKGYSRAEKTIRETQKAEILLMLEQYGLSIEDLKDESAGE